MSSTDSLPLVSIVIPARNAGARLREVLDACQRQDYPGRWEILVVDNGSVDDTKAIATGYSGVRFLVEGCHSQSPYSARNRGIQVAQGEIIAMLDATCVPLPNWLAEGVCCMQKAGPCIVAGQVRFRLSPGRPRAAELWDAVSNVQQDLAVSRGRAKTGNLFIHRTLLRKQGLFREGVRSGEDVRWTAAAKAAGWTIIYAADAIVDYPARGCRRLMRKLARTGAGRARQVPLLQRLIRGTAMLVLPPAPRQIRRALRERAPVPHVSALTTVRVWMIAWLMRVVHGMGFLLPNLFQRAD